MEHFSKLKQFQQISEQMLSLAEDDQWEQLPDLEIERKQLIHSFFTQQNLSGDDHFDVERVIKKVLTINDKISHLAEQQQLFITEQLHGMKKRQSVHSAYLQNK